MKVLSAEGGDIMARIVVTGGTGFVGRHVVDMLVEQDHEVTAIARPTSDTSHMESLGVAVIRGELYDVDFLADAMKGSQQLHHMASLIDTAWARPEDFYRSNVTATRAVYEAAAKTGIRDSVNMSSISVMGAQPAGSVITEETRPLHGFSHPYGHSKYLGENEAFSFAEQGMRVMAINPTLIYGSGDRNLYPDVARFIRGEDIGPIDPEHRNSLVHVDDVARGQILAMERGTSGERYIVSAKTIKVVEFYAIMAEALGRTPPETASRPQDSPVEAYKGSGLPDLPPEFADRSNVDNTKSKRELGLSYMSLDSSLADVVRAIRAEMPKQVDEIPRRTLSV